MKAWAEEWEWLAQRALEAMGNGLWQGLLAAGLIWAGFRLLPRLNAATRYAAALAGMLVVSALPLAQFAVAGGENSQAILEVPVQPMESKEVWESGLAGASSHPNASASEHGWGEAQAEPLSPPAMELSPSERTKPRGLASWNILRKEWTVAAPTLVVLALLAFWAAVSTAKLAVLAWQCIALHALKKSSRAPSESLLAEFHRLAESLRLPRPAHLGIAPELAGPIAAGFFRPMVLVPASFETLAHLPAGRARLEAVLRHELAHIARRDDWTNLLQQVLQAIYFFHPGVVWLGRRMSLEREIACDDHALDGIGRGSRKEYALLLTDFARQALGPEWAAAPGAWGSEHQLKERIHMILDKNRNASTRLAGAKAGVLSLGALLVALLAMQAGPRLAVAEEAKAASAHSLTSTTEPFNLETTGSVVITQDADSSAATIRSSGSEGRGGASGGGGASSVFVTKDGDVMKVTSGPRKKTVEALHAHSEIEPHPDAKPVHPDARPAQPPRPPEPPRPPKANSYQSEDLERRLERLERRLESLDNKEAPGPDLHFKKDFKFEFDEPRFREQMARMEKDFKVQSEAMRRVHDEARRAGELARRDAEKAAEEVRKSVREIEKDGKVQREVRVEVRRQGVEQKARRKALEQQRRELEKQLEAVERELERAEHEAEEQDRQAEELARDEERSVKRRATEDPLTH